jgi:antitoxin HicB
LANAEDCLEEIIASLMKDKQDIPNITLRKNKGLYVNLSPTFSAKVLLYKAMREQHITKSDLARRLHWKYPQVERLFDTHHSSRLSQLVMAAEAPGKVFVVGMEDSQH